MENILQKHVPLESRTKFYLILALISLTLFFYSVWEIKWVVVDISDFLGLTSHLTIAYWVGLGLITLCSILVYLDDELKNHWIFIFILIVVGLFLFGLGVFAEENARFPCSYYPAGEVKTVLATHHIDTISPYNLLSYRCWPASHFISASILYITGIELSGLIKYMPLFWIVCFIFITFAIGKLFKFSSNQSFLLSFLALSSFWLPQYYYGPQSFAYILYLLIFMLIATISNTSNILNKEILSILIFVVLVLTHLVTTIFVLLSLFILSIYKKETKFVIPSFLIFMVWYIYLAPVVFEVGVRQFVDQATTMDFFSFGESTKFVATTQIKEIVNNFRLSYLGIYVICTIMAIIYTITQPIKKERKEQIVMCFFWIIGASILVPLNYNLEIYERAYIYCLTPAICIMILSFSNRKFRKFLAILMILLIAIHIPAHYGSESYDMIYTSELVGCESFVTKIQPNQIYFGRGRTLSSYFDPSMVKFPQISSFGSFYKYNDTQVVTTIQPAAFVINSKQTDNFYKFYYNYNPLEIWKRNKPADEIKLIYNNGFFDIYVQE